MTQRSHLNFEGLLFEAVDEGLSSIGESAKQAIYYYLENGSHIKRQDIPYRVEDFETAIEKIFGLGASFLHIIVLKQLYGKIGQSFELPVSNDLSFAKCVEDARKLMYCEPDCLEIET